MNDGILELFLFDFMEIKQNKGFKGSKCHIILWYMGSIVSTSSATPTSTRGS